MIKPLKLIGVTAASLLLLSACGDDTPEAESLPTEDSAEDNTTENVTDDVFAIGDSVTMYGVTMTINDINYTVDPEIETGDIVLDVTYDNHSGDTAIMRHVDFTLLSGDGSPVDYAEMQPYLLEEIPDGQQLTAQITATDLPPGMETMSIEWLMFDYFGDAAVFNVEL